MTGGLRNCLTAALALGALALGGCDWSVLLQLNLQDPGAVLRDSAFIELEITSAGAGETETSFWPIADGLGELSNLPPYEDAVVTVVARSANAVDAPGFAVGAASVGVVDLTGGGGDPVIDIELVLRRIGSFHSTLGDGSPVELISKRREHTATLLQDGRVLIAGGYEPLLATGETQWWMSMEYYSPATSDFELGPDMQWGRRGHTATVLDDGRVLLTGGEGPIDDDGDPNTRPVTQTLLVAIVYDPADETFGSPVPMQQQRAYHSATRLGDGEVLLVGGTFGPTLLQTTEIFDPTTGTTRPGPNLQARRAYHTAVRIGRSQVAIIGGQGTNGPVETVEFVDLVTGSAIQGPDLQTGRSHAAAALMPGFPAVIAVAGGFTSNVTAAEFGLGIDTVELIQLNTSRLDASIRLPCTTLRLREARGAPAVAPLADGLMLAGGVGPSGEISATAEILRLTDPAACLGNAEYINGVLNSPRAEARLTPLMGGDLLLSGGLGRSQGEVIAIGRGEIYTAERP